MQLPQPLFSNKHTTLGLVFEAWFWKGEDSLSSNINTFFRCCTCTNNEENGNTESRHGRGQILTATLLKSLCCLNLHLLIGTPFFWVL